MTGRSLESLNSALLRWGNLGSHSARSTDFHRLSGIPSKNSSEKLSQRLAQMPTRELGAKRGRRASSEKAFFMSPCTASCRSLRCMSEGTSEARGELTGEKASNATHLSCPRVRVPAVEGWGSTSAKHDPPLSQRYRIERGFTCQTVVFVGSQGCRFPSYPDSISTGAGKYRSVTEFFLLHQTMGYHIQRHREGDD